MTSSMPPTWYSRPPTSLSWSLAVAGTSFLVWFSAPSRYAACRSIRQSSRCSPKNSPILPPSRAPARRFPGQCRSAKLYQPLVRALRPGSDFTDRRLGGDGGGRSDADRKPSLHVDAWDDFYRALKPGGLLSVSRWYKGTSTAANSIGWLRSQPAPCSAGACRPPTPSSCCRAERGQHRNSHYAARRVHRARWQEARGKLEAQGLKLFLGPDVAFDAITSTLYRQGGRGILQFLAGEHRSID